MDELKTRIKNVAVYLRKSRNNEGEEDEQTLSKHRKRLLEIVKKNTWEYELFQEVGSSMNEHRPQYVKMLKKLNDGVFDAVLSVNLARVTRDDAETPKFMNLLREEDILFITDSERIYDLEVQEDWQALKFTGFVNNWEYENIKAQLRKGKKDSAKLGRWSNGVPNFGYIYNRIEKKLDIDEHKAKAVRLAFQWCIEGKSVDDIAIELNQLGYRTNKGNMFHGESIRRMLTAEIYKGWIVANKLKGRNVSTGKIRPQEQWIIRKGVHEPIVSEEIWDNANNELEKRKQLSPRLKQHKHGLSSLIRCAKCGKAHPVIERKDRLTGRKTIQPCTKKNLLGVKCYNRGVPYDDMMNLIIMRIAEHKEETIQYLETYKIDAGAIDTKAAKIDQVKVRIKVVRKALDNLQIQFEEGLIELDAFKERTLARKQELNQLETELESLTDTTKEDEINHIQTYINGLDKFLNEWESFDEEKLNFNLLKIIDKVILKYDKGDEKPEVTFVWNTEEFEELEYMKMA